MHRLASSVTDLKARYDVVVVGSGYGGAVAACRMARWTPRDGPGGKADAGSERDDGLSVCVLERGSEFRPGEYPDTLSGALRQTQVHRRGSRLGSATGLYDFRVGPDVSVFQGCGLGGGSLVNAGVMLRSRREVLRDPRWPGAIRDEVGDRASELEKGFRRALEMLDASPYPRSVDPPPRPWAEGSHPWPPLSKLDALDEALSRSTRASATVERPPIAVSFESRVNRAGVQQHACRLCGDCVSGCNYSAKNTLIMNYLPDARNHGAEIFCGTEVRWLERDGRDWIVLFDLHGPGRKRLRSDRMFVRAGTVILAAGTLGTNEILLRSREMGLPLSDRLGHGFSGNGDILAFGYNLDRTVEGVGMGSREPSDEEPVGPTITGTIDLRDGTGGMVIQEGVIPGPLAPVVRFLAPLTARFAGRDTDRGFRDRIREIGRELLTLLMGARRGAGRHTLTYLANTPDDEPLREAGGAAGSSGGRKRSGRAEAFGGRIHLDRGRAVVHWPGIGRNPAFEAVHRRLARLTRALGGTRLLNAVGTGVPARRLVTVHPLGGCAMGEDAGDGVVDHEGRVFSSATPGSTAVHEGLFVCDGSVIPRSLGANPLWTITALAERTCALLSRRLRGRPSGESAGGAADRDRPAAAPDVEVPDSAADPPGETALGPGPPPTVGIRFAERMAGHLRWSGEEEPGSRVQLALTIESGDVDALLEDESHPASIVGTARVPAVDASHALMVTEGSFRLLVVDPDRVETRMMCYRMKLTARDGEAYWLVGRKRIHDEPLRKDLWKDLSRLEYVLYRASPDEAWHEAPERPTCGRGVLRVRWWELPWIVMSATVTNSESRIERLRTRIRFGLFFATNVFQIFGGLLRPAKVPDPYGRRLPGTDRAEPGESDCAEPFRSDARGPRPLRRPRPDPEETRLEAPDGADLLLTRYRPEAVARPKGPVILAPGWGTNSYAYVLPTIERNLTDYLLEREYDVWLMDYRGSDRTRASAGQFTVEDIARYDYPTAIDHVRTATGADDVQVLGHCVASVALMISLLEGWATGVRSAVCSQFHIAVEQPVTNRLKAQLRIATALDALGRWPTLNPDYDRSVGVGHRIADRILHLYPSRERCRNPVCRRILFLYGEVIRHDQVNAATHDAMHDMFDRANLTTFRHLAAMVRHLRAVDPQGRNAHLTPEKGRNLDLPITLFHGTENGLFLLDGAVKSLRWIRAVRSRRVRALEEALGEPLHTLALAEGYGHMDPFVGRDAWKEVYPILLDELERGERLAERMEALRVPTS